MIKNNNNDLDENISNTDKDIEKMILEWDIVMCENCGKKISMLDAELIEDKYFICRNGC